MASLYAMLSRRGRLEADRAARPHADPEVLAAGLERLGYSGRTMPRFDTLKINLGDKKSADILKTPKRIASTCAIDDKAIGISLDEAASAADVTDAMQGVQRRQSPRLHRADLTRACHQERQARLRPHRQSSSNRAVFNRYHSETEMLRYIKRLESRDLSLTASMIPLGSCTMKLNAAAEMFPVSWPEFGEDSSVRAHQADARLPEAV
jgi:glycine dehydrogenase